MSVAMRRSPMLRLRCRWGGFSAHIRFLVSSGGHGFIRQRLATQAERVARCVHADTVRPRWLDIQCGFKRIDPISVFYRKLLEPSPKRRRLVARYLASSFGRPDWRIHREARE